MKSVWALQDAKNQFSRVVDRACKDGPQMVTRHGRECVVIISAEVLKKKKRSGTLSSFFQNSPLSGVDLDITRSKAPFREVSL